MDFSSIQLIVSMRSAVFFLLNTGLAGVVDETVVDCSLANSRIIVDSYRMDALLRARTRDLTITIGRIVVAGD